MRYDVRYCSSIAYKIPTVYVGFSFKEEMGWVGKG
jgi:hypothetical protein